MAAQDTVQLLIEILGQDGIDRLSRSTENYRNLLIDLAEKLKAGDISADEFTRTQSKLSRELEREEALLARLKGTTDAAGEAVEKTGSKMAGLGQAGLQAGRALQDFTQGGIGGILNNIEGLSMALGGGAGLAGVMTAVGLAAFLAKPYIEKWTESFGPVKEKIPDATDKIEQLTKAVKDQKEQLDELTKKRELDYFEMQKYTQQVDDLRKKEEELSLAREARQVGTGQGKATRERAGAFREALAEYGGGNKLIEVLMNSGMSEREAEEAIVDAQRGSKGAAQRIQRATAGAPKSSQFNYVDPEAARQQAAIDAFSEQGAKEAAGVQEKADAAQKAREARRAALAHSQTDAALKENARKIRVGKDIDSAIQSQIDEPPAHSAATMRQAAGIQRQLRGAGQNVPIDAIAAELERQQKDLERAEREALGAMVGAMSGTADQIVMWRQAQQSANQFAGRLHRGMEQSPLPSGSQR